MESSSIIYISTFPASNPMPGAQCIFEEQINKWINRWINKLLLLLKASRVFIVQNSQHILTASWLSFGPVGINFSNSQSKDHPWACCSQKKRKKKSCTSPSSQTSKIVEDEAIWSLRAVGASSQWHIEGCFGSSTAHFYKTPRREP